MKQEERTKRKGGNQKGVMSTKMMCFKVDVDLLDWLQTKPNKGRLINELLHAERERERQQM